jgi:hypothetical protein
MTATIDDEQIAAHGGAYGVLNGLMLESALARLQNLDAYERTDLSHKSIDSIFSKSNTHKSTQYLVYLAWLISAFRRSG